MSFEREALSQASVRREKKGDQINSLKAYFLISTTTKEGI